jgi:hypothetical protein
MLLALGLVACTSSPQPKITPPDTSELTSLYPTAPRVQETPPFAIDLSTCSFTNHAVPTGAVEGGDRFALAHTTDTGECEVWLGYNGMIGMHADMYCAFEPAGTANVVEGSPSTGGGGCGGPPGTLPLTIDSNRCVPVTN